MYIMTNQKYFPESKIVYLKDKLRTMDEEKFSLISTIEMKDPTTVLLVSIFFVVRKENLKKMALWLAIPVWAS